MNNLHEFTFLTNTKHFDASQVLNNNRYNSKVNYTSKWLNNLNDNDNTNGNRRQSLNQTHLNNESIQSKRAASLYSPRNSYVPPKDYYAKMNDEENLSAKPFVPGKLLMLSNNNYQNNSNNMNNIPPQNRLQSPPPSIDRSRLRKIDLSNSFNYSNSQETTSTDSSLTPTPPPISNSINSIINSNPKMLNQEIMSQ